MYIITNAIKNIGRNKGRNIFMMLMILTIIVTTVIALTINNTAGQIIDEYKQKFGSQVTIQPNFDVLRTEGRDAMDGKQITPEQYLSFSESDYLKDSSINFSVMANSDTVTAIDEDKLDELMGGGDAGRGGPSLSMRVEGEDGSTEEVTSPTMMMIGVSDVTDLTEFTTGERTIQTGEMFTNVNEVVISQELAEANDISVGDEITIYNVMNKDVGVYNVKVTGIYQDSTDEYSDEMPFEMPSSNRRNEILTSYETVFVPDYDSTASGVSGDATYYLKNASDIDKFEAELREKGLDAIYLVSTDEESISTIVTPVEGLKNVTQTFMVVVFVLGSIILILLANLSMRERKYEIGVLRAIGMKKSKVTGGLITEMIVITLICFLLGLGVGGVAAQSVSDKLLASQLEKVQSSASSSMDNGGGGGPGQGGQMVRIGGGGISFGNSSDVEPLTELDVSLNLQTVGQIFGISMLLALISSSIGIAYISRYEPMKILSNRD